jgi:hypothetical protein
VGLAQLVWAASGRSLSWERRALITGGNPRPNGRILPASGPPEWLQRVTGLFAGEAVLRERGDKLWTVVYKRDPTVTLSPGPIPERMRAWPRGVIRAMSRRGWCAPIVRPSTQGRVLPCHAVDRMSGITAWLSPLPVRVAGQRIESAKGEAASCGSTTVSPSGDHTTNLISENRAGPTPWVLAARAAA